MMGVPLPRAALAALGIVLAAGVASAQPAAQPAATQPAAAQPAAAPAPAATSAGAIGADLAGSPCRWEARTDVPIERGVPQAANIFCGDSKQPTGTVSATLMPLGLPADDAPRRQALEHAAAESSVGRQDAARMSCAAGQWDNSTGVDLGLQQCALNDSEWPQVVAVAPIGTMLVRGEGLPSSLPALEQAMARMGGLTAAQTTAFTDQTAAHDRLVKLGGERWITATSANFDDYNTLTETARTEASRKNYSGAEGHYRSAVTILTNVFGAQSPGVGLLLLDLGLQISNQERFDEAAALFRRADPIIQTNGTAADRAHLLLYQAFDAANRGHFDEALEYASNSVGTWRGILAQGGGLGGDEINADPGRATQRGELAFALDLTAEMALRTGNLSAADAAASESADIITDTQGLPPGWRAEVLTTIGEIRAAQGRMDDADAAFRAALILQERLYGSTAPTAVTYLTFARVFADQKLYEESVRAYRLALDILRKDPVARSEVVVDQIAPFVTAANAVAKSNPAEAPQLNAELFEATQLIGKSLVDDTVNRVAARLSQADPAIGGLVDDLEKTRRERDADRMALAQEVSLPNDQRGSIRENQLMAQINAATAKADSLQKQIEAQFPDYSKFANPGPVPLSEAQQALGPGEAFVLIEAGRERSFAILVRKDALLARPVTLDAGAIAESVTNLRKAFIVRERQVEPFDLGRAYTLYRSLFGGIQTGLSGVNHLIVVPTGALASLPLGLLVTQTPKPRDYTGAQFLIQRTAISVVPSARAFISQREQRGASAADRPFFAVANPSFTGAAPKAAGAASNGLVALDNECRDEGPVPAQLLRALPPLPDTADEVRKVAAIEHADNGSILMGADATEARVRAMPLAQYHVLYFATHGLLPTALRCQSEPALALSPPPTPATSRDTDGMLDASEVAQLHLNADLVVLSACNTATSGGQFGGESLSGLAGAFFHAGARTVLASHWEVPSAQTVQLMTGLFQRLGPNLNAGIADALRQSQLALIAKPETAHPFFWAAFTLIGDGGTAQARGSADLSPTTGAVASSSGARLQPLSEKQQ